MNIYKTARVGLAVCLFVISISTQASTKQLDTKETDIYLYAQATDKSQHTTKRISLKELSVVSLALDWMQVRSNSPITAWVPLDSVRLVDERTARTPSYSVAAHFDKSLTQNAEINTRLPIVLAPESLFSVKRIENDTAEIELSSNLMLWVKSEDYLTASQMVKTNNREYGDLANGERWGSRDLDDATIPPTLEENAPAMRDPFLTWLCNQSPTQKTLQLASFKAPAEINSYLKNNPTLDNNNLVRAQSQDLSWHYLLYGQYSNDTDAQREMEQLGLSRKSTSIRSIDYLQSKRCEGSRLATVQ